MKTRTPLMLFTAGTLTLSGCMDEPPLSPRSDPLLSGGVRSSIQQVVGETGPGSTYALFVPPEWNGRLILYAHGFIDPALPVALPTNDQIEPLRDELLQRGYAVGYSSFSENGLALKDAAQRTHQLNGLFASKFRKPESTYLMGHSLGAVATLMLTERHPTQYAGALPMCGQVGGTQAAVDYVAHTRVLFDYFYPGVLPGTALEIPEGVDLNTQVILPAVAAIQSNPFGAGAIARIMMGMGMPVPAGSAPQLVESLVRTLGYNFRGFHDLFDRTHGHSPFDNTGTTYFTPALPPALLDDLNARVDRFSSTPDAAHYLRKYYEPTGKLQIPVLTLYNALDPISPPMHEPRYRQAVDRAGRSQLMVQRRSANLYGHCNFTVGEMVQALEDLVRWREEGVRPAA